MASKNENKLIIQALATINKQYGRAYSKLIQAIPSLLEEFYEKDTGFEDVQEIINAELEKINGFSQLEVYTRFYNAAYKDAIRAAKVQYQLGYNFSQIDTKAINQLTSQNNWLISKYQTLTDQQQTLRKMKELWETGKPINEAVKELDDIFRKSNKRINAHTKVTLVTNNTRIRTTADLNTFDQNGITSYIYRAVVDNVTTETCRDLNGNKYEVRKALDYQNKIDTEMNKIISDGERKGWPDWKIYNKGMEYLLENDSFATEGKGKRPWKTGFIRRTADPLRQGKEIKRSYKNLASVPGNKIPRPPLHNNCRSRLEPQF